MAPSDQSDRTDSTPPPPPPPPTFNPVVATAEHFFVLDAVGPLRRGEGERAVRWGEELARALLRLRLYGRCRARFLLRRDDYFNRRFGVQRGGENGLDLLTREGIGPVNHAFQYRPTLNQAVGARLALGLLLFLQKLL